MLHRIRNLLRRITTGNERSVKVKKNFIASLGIKGVSIAVTFFLVPITLGYVSEELYGIWLILSSVLLMLHYFDVGFTLGLKNKLTEAIAVNDFKKGKQLVSTTYMMLTIIFIPLGIILEIATPLIPWAEWFNTPDKYNVEITNALRVMFICVCLQMIVNTLGSVLSAYQKTAVASLFPVVGNVVSLIVIVFLKNFTEPSLTKLAFAISTMPVIVLTVASIWLYSTVYKGISPSIRFVRFDLVKEIFGLGAKFFIIQIQIIVVSQAANIFISNFSSPIEVANYNVALRYLNVAMMVFNILLTPIWPAFTDAYAKKDFVWMKSIYMKLRKILLLTIGVIVFMVIISPVIYKLWIGNKMNIPFAMTVAVSIYVITLSWNTFQTILINGFGTVKLQTYVTLTGLIIYIPLALVLGKFLGAIGVVLSMATIYLLYAPVFSIQLNKLINDRAFGIWKA